MDIQNIEFGVLFLLSNINVDTTALFAKDVGRFPNPEVDYSRTNDPNLSIFNVLSLSLSQHLTAIFSSTGYGESFVKLVSKSNFTLSIPKPHPL